MIAVVAMTPYYVLMERNRRIGPNVLPLVSGIDCLPIYGFSDKGPYDRFCASSPLALTPYSITEEMVNYHSTSVERTASTLRPSRRSRLIAQRYWSLSACN
jgi:hypothetical protein